MTLSHLLISNVSALLRVYSMNEFSYLRADNRVGDEGAVALATALSINNNLTSLYLAGTYSQI